MNGNTIEEQLEKEITRGVCHTCKKVYKDDDCDWCCGVTEEKLDSGNTYCDLK